MNNEKKEYVVLTRTKTETNELMEKNYKNLNKANDYIVSAELTEEQCVELENDENIKCIEENKCVTACAEFSEYEKDYLWNLEAIGLSDTHKITRGKDVKVAIIDTGIDEYTEVIIDGGVNLINADEGLYDSSGH